jgi:hypothetical protein
MWGQTCNVKRCLVLKLSEDFIEMWSECRIRALRLAEFCGKGER